MITADRIVQLDHQTRGRAMFGFGPGQLPADASKLGIPAHEQRARMADAVDVIVRLLAGETVTRITDWYTLREAALHVGPFTRPRPHLAVASAMTPSGGRVAGRHGLGMLFFAATSGPRHEILSSNWRIAGEEAAEHGQVMDRSALRLVAPFHIAATRDQALSEAQTGHARWCTHMNEEFEGLPARAGLENLEKNQRRTRCHRDRGRRSQRPEAILDHVRGLRLHPRPTDLLDRRGGRPAVVPDICRGGHARAHRYNVTEARIPHVVTQPSGRTRCDYAPGHR